MKKITLELLSELEKFDSATIQNAGVLVKGFTKSNSDYTNPDLSRMVKKKSCVVGLAIPSPWTPISSDVIHTSNKYNFYDTINDETLHTIAVLKDVDSQIKRGAIIGDGMAYMMKSLGAVGAIVDGNARDIEGVKKANLDLWATGRVPGHGPFEMIEYNITLNVCDLLIKPGDILVCDDDGVTNVDTLLVKDTIKACYEVREKESKMHKYFQQKNFSKKTWEKWKLNN